MGITDRQPAHTAKQSGRLTRLRRLWRQQPRAVQWFCITSVALLAAGICCFAVYPSDTAQIIVVVAAVIFISLGLNTPAATRSLTTVSRVWRAFLLLIVGGLAIALAIWAVNSMSIPVAILVGAVSIAGAIGAARR